MNETNTRLIEKIKREFGPLIMNELKKDSVIEVMVNPDGSVWVEHMGEEMICVGTSPKNLKAVIGTIASFVGTTITRENPILECELPLDGSRFEGLIPPVVSQTTFAIRKKAIKIFKLEDYLVTKETL